MKTTMRTIRIRSFRNRALISVVYSKICLLRKNDWAVNRETLSLDMRRKRKWFIILGPTHSREVRCSPAWTMKMTLLIRASGSSTKMMKSCNRTSPNSSMRKKRRAQRWWYRRGVKWAKTCIRSSRRCGRGSVAKSTLPMGPYRGIGNLVRDSPASIRTIWFLDPVPTPRLSLHLIITRGRVSTIRNPFWAAWDLVARVTPQSVVANPKFFW